tara:strand:+ start:542 stop:826 length:285 start_codon:yes stop_codon:yes gene_type:complete
MNEQVINYGNQKLLLLNGTAHKMDSKTAIDWAYGWFTANWGSVKVIGSKIHLGSLATVNKAAADFVANSAGRTERNLIACICEGKMNNDLGIAA